MTPQRINDEANAAAKKEEERLKKRPIDYGRMVSQITGYHSGYIAGATAENNRVEDEIDKALHAERNKMQAKFSELDKQYAVLLKEQREKAQGLVDVLEGLLEWHNTALGYGLGRKIEAATEALAKWKGEAEEAQEQVIPTAVYKQRGSKIDNQQKSK